VMATRPATAAKAVRDLSAEVAYLTRALKAPTLRESVEPTIWPLIGSGKQARS
jgi:hypothetical protein